MTSNPRHSCWTRYVCLFDLAQVAPSDTDRDLKLSITALPAAGEVCTCKTGQLSETFMCRDETQAPLRATPPLLILRHPQNERKGETSRPLNDSSQSFVFPFLTNETVLLGVGRGDPVRVLRGLLGVAQDGLSRVAVVRLVQGDVLHDEGGQGAAVSRHSASPTCRDTMNTPCKIQFGMFAHTLLLSHIQLVPCILVW